LLSKPPARFSPNPLRNFPSAVCLHRCVKVLSALLRVLLSPFAGFIPGHRVGGWLVRRSGVHL
jgi:hypothetical protein